TRGGAAMDVRGGRRTAQPGVLDAPRRLLRRGIDIDLRRALARRLDGRHFGGAGESGLLVARRGIRPGECRRRREKSDNQCCFAHDLPPRLNNSRTAEAIGLAVTAAINDIALRKASLRSVPSVTSSRLSRSAKRRLLMTAFRLCSLSHAGLEP